MFNVLLSSDPPKPHYRSKPNRTEGQGPVMVPGNLEQN